MEKEESIRFVKELWELQEKKRELEKRIDELKKEFGAFSDSTGIDVIEDPEIVMKIQKRWKVVYPEDKAYLVNVIKKKGLYESLSHLNYPRLSSKIIKGDVDEEIAKLVTKERAHRIVVERK